MQYNLVIRMGAPYWDAKVNSGSEWVHFDIAKMDKQDRRKFVFEVVRAFREAGLR